MVPLPQREYPESPCARGTGRASKPYERHRSEAAAGEAAADAEHGYGTSRSLVNDGYAMTYRSEYSRAPL